MKEKFVDWLFKRTLKSSKHKNLGFILKAKIRARAKQDAKDTANGGYFSTFIDEKFENFREFLLGLAGLFKIEYREMTTHFKELLSVTPKTKEELLEIISQAPTPPTEGEMYFAKPGESNLPENLIAKRRGREHDKKTAPFRAKLSGTQEKLKSAEKALITEYANIYSCFELYGIVSDMELHHYKAIVKYYCGRLFHYLKKNGYDHNDEYIKTLSSQIADQTLSLFDPNHESFMKVIDGYKTDFENEFKLALETRKEAA